MYPIPSTQSHPLIIEASSTQTPHFTVHSNYLNPSSIICISTFADNLIAHQHYQNTLLTTSTFSPHRVQTKNSNTHTHFSCHSFIENTSAHNTSKCRNQLIFVRYCQTSFLFTLLIFVTKQTKKIGGNLIMRKNMTYKLSHAYTIKYN